ncbi:PBP1A family penicillin-binding protein [Paenibacillus sp. WQ 127069]|uniref:PBP1A family penicillin-binding protein n=1 Tax=Paenibacillus baimaensis TaxID=2982185 RepID=A0ABT2UT08_9BACL|nr:PBP1A family penicillin-binding protein [Paenibacillus sp. WQ 127069]MCU6797156.1 PBP1A family penicillin-binding protein [Paenibacillus sp. WQ 127069]
MQPLSTQEQKKPKSGLKRSRWWRFSLWITGSILLVGLLIAGAGALWMSQLDISKLEHPLPEPTLIMDRNAQPASQLSSSRIEPVPLKQIPLELRNAVIAVEDRRFYEHSGVDIWSITRALWRDLISGSMKEGGSTLTQQLAKNLFLQSDKTISRKLKEAAYALKINMTYTKDEILELYLNSIYFGEGRWGVQGAALEYFAKPVSQLNLVESALLAALPKAPTTYSPAKNKDKALERRNLVLLLMKEQQFITTAAYNQAIVQPITLQQQNEESLKGKYPSYVDYVIEEAAELYGFTEEQILTSGLRIYTDLDPVIQQTTEEIYGQPSLFPESRTDQMIQSGAVIMDHRTGGIRALIGTRGPQVYRGFNHATQLRRQPGSSFKPLAVYGPALERGYTSSSVLYDGKLDIGGYRPRDWDGQTRGQVTLKEAILRSWNIPAVWLLNQIGIEAGLDFVQRAGIPLTAADRSLSLALGGLSEGVSPLQMAQAYGGIANLGVMQKAHAILKITTKDGHTLVEAVPQSSVLTRPTVAYDLTLLLQEAVKSGTGSAAAIGRPAAGKTGTTQLPDTPEFSSIGANGAKDAWFVGFTPELTTAIWLGYDQTDRDHYLVTSGGAVPAALFNRIMSRVLRDAPVTPFPIPGVSRNPSAEPALRSR